MQCSVNETSDNNKRLITFSGFYCNTRNKLPVVHDDEELEVRVFLAEVDQGCRLPGSGKSHDLDDVAGLRVQWMMNNPEI